MSDKMSAPSVTEFLKQWDSRESRPVIDVARDMVAEWEAMQQPAAGSRPALATSIVTEDDGSGDLISPDCEAAERVYDPAFIAEWKAARSRPVTDGTVPVPAAWGRIIDGVAVTVSREWTRANSEPLYAAPPASTVSPQQDCTGWRPIETAPTAPDRDPPVVMLWVSDGGSKGTGTHSFGRCYKSHDGSVRGVASGFSGNWKITHWMPLPAPPLPRADRGSGDA